MNQHFWQCSGWVLAGILFYFLIFYALFEVKLDRTRDGDLLLWYTTYDKRGSATRKYIIIFRKNQK
jgi:hypothetical protein